MGSCFLRIYKKMRVILKWRRPRIWIGTSWRFFQHFLILIWNIIDDKKWDTSTSSQVSNCDGVMLKIYLDQKFQWPHEGLNCETLSCKGLIVLRILSTRIRYLTTGVAALCWDTSTSSHVSNCDGVVLEIYLDHKFQWP